MRKLDLRSLLSRKAEIGSHGALGHVRVLGLLDLAPTWNHMGEQTRCEREGLSFMPQQHRK